MDRHIAPDCSAARRLAGFWQRRVFASAIVRLSLLVIARSVAASVPVPSPNSQQVSKSVR